MVKDPTLWEVEGKGVPWTGPGQQLPGDSNWSHNSQVPNQRDLIIIQTKTGRSLCKTVWLVFLIF